MLLFSEILTGILLSIDILILMLFPILHSSVEWKPCCGTSFT